MPKAKSSHDECNHFTVPKQILGKKKTFSKGYRIAQLKDKALHPTPSRMIIRV
jgi:hypothetical protein